MTTQLFLKNNTKKIIILISLISLISLFCIIIHKKYLIYSILYTTPFIPKKEIRPNILNDYVKDYEIVKRLETIFYERIKKGNDYCKKEYIDILNKIKQNKNKIETMTLDVLNESNYYKLQDFIKERKPVVLKNYFKNIHSIYSSENIINTHGDVDVVLTGENGTNLDKLKKIKTNTKLYAQNCSKLTLIDKSYNDNLPLKELKASKWQFTSSQLFISLQRGTGIPYHCAHDDNFFFMLEGKKRWTFIDPAYTFLINPYITKCRNYFMSLIGSNTLHSDENSPLYNYIPKYEYILEKGDLLYNPSFWWHSIDNHTETTVGMSTRWYRYLNYDTTNKWMIKVLESWKSIKEREKFMSSNKSIVVDEHSHTMEGAWDKISSCGYEEMIEKYPYLFKRLFIHK